MTLVLTNSAQDYSQASALAKICEIRNLAEYSDSCRGLSAEFDRLQSLDEEDAPTEDSLRRARAFVTNVLAGLGDSVPPAKACVAFDFGIDIYWRGQDWSVQIHIPGMRNQESYIYVERGAEYWIEYPSSDPNWCSQIFNNIPTHVRHSMFDASYCF